MKALRVILPSILAVALLPASASAATVTVTGDDGNPLGINATAPTPIRNMSPEYVVTFGSGDGVAHQTSSVGPDGAATSDPTRCYPTDVITSQRRPMYYRGNGNYAVVVSTFTDEDCTKGRKDTSYLFSINGGTGITAPPAKFFLTRQRNSFATITHRFGVGLNPGTNAYEFKYAKGGVLGPDGGFTGPAEDAFVSRDAGFADLRFREPGTYTAVVRGMTNNYFTPWSAPVTFQVKAPFDLSFVTFPDSRGPTYKLRAQMRDKFARGKRVTVYAARGRKGGKFRRLGRSSKVSSRGRFTLRFRLNRTGRYRMQYRFKGSSLVTKGKVTEVVTIRRFRF